LAPSLGASSAGVHMPCSDHTPHSRAVHRPTVGAHHQL
jgi:hypothetical protein